MWNIVKAELNYMNPWARFALGFPVIISLLFAYDWSRIGLFQGDITMCVPLAIGLHLVFNLVLLFNEYRENRLRMHAALPVRKIKIVISRIAGPFLLLVFFALVCLITMGVLYYVEDSAWAYYETSNADPHLLSKTNFETLEADILYWVPVWLFITFASRLIFEHYGRIVLIFVFVIGLINQQLTDRGSVLTDPGYTGVTEGIFNPQYGINTFFVKPYGYYTFPILTAIILLVMMYSFQRRKSFLK